MQGCSVFFDNGEIIRYMNILNYGELLCAGSILDKHFQNKEDVEKLFEYVWLSIPIKPSMMDKVQGLKGKTIKFLDHSDIQDFIKNKDLDISCAYYYREGMWYYTDNNQKDGGWGIIKR